MRTRSRVKKSPDIETSLTATSGRSAVSASAIRRPLVAPTVMSCAIGFLPSRPEIVYIFICIVG